MTEKTRYEPGQFSWIDLSAADMATAAPWYADLFGWEFQPGEAPWNYGMFLKGGKSVCGLGQLRDEMKAAGVPPTWNSYVNVDNAQAIAARVDPAGGQVTVPVMEVGSFGKMACFTDPTGANFGIWQPGSHPGAQLVNEDDTLTWNELLTQDVARAKAFYVEVFGWTTDEVPMPNGATYTMFKNKDAMNAGMLPMPEQAGDMPSQWDVYFQVTNLDGLVAKAQASGGAVIMGPMSIPQGTIAKLRDPQGAVFCAIQPAQGSSPA
ncbi:MAG: VOC family protein [Myxococcales bacterium FL481]|nr:MAG: VOC family protein [Myxococcales bacterium FL481]